MASLTATSATGITTTGATVNGVVVTGGGALTGIVCAYSTTDSGWISGSSAPATPATVAMDPSDAPTAVSCPLSGLEASTTYYVQIQGTRSSIGYSSNTISFKTGGSPPSPVMTATTGIGVSTATVNGTITTTLATSSIACRIACTPGGVATGTVFAASPSSTGVVSNLPVSCALTGLNPSTRYYAGIFATDAAGTAGPPTYARFETRAKNPAVGTVGVGGVGETTASLTASITPANEAVTGVFCRVIAKPGNPANGTVLAATPYTLAPAMVASSVTCNVTGLAPSTAYLARMEATDRNGTAASPNIVTFTTAAQSGGGGGGGGGGGAPEPVATPVSAGQTEPPAASPSPQPTTAASVLAPLPSLKRVLPGLSVLEHPRPGSVRRTKPITPGPVQDRVAKLDIARSVPTAIVIKGLAPYRKASVSVRLATGGTWRSLAALQATKAGWATLPPLVGTGARSYVVRVVQEKRPPGYLQLRIVATPSQAR